MIYVRLENKKTVPIEMSPSKIDRYLNLLEVLVSRPQKIARIEHQVKMEHQALKQHLGFLVANGVIEERRSSNKQIAYAITERGLAVFKTLRAFKYFEKLRKALPIVEEAREISAALSKYSRALKEE